MRLPFLLALVAAAAASSASAASDVTSRLDEEDKSWHRYAVFTSAAAATSPDDRAKVLDWFRRRLANPESVDSRYAITYSYLVWQTKAKQDMVQGVMFAVTGYLALQLETAHCETRNEAAQIARQWYDYVRPQLLNYMALPREIKDKMFAEALVVASAMTSQEAQGSRVGADWICYLLPSYSSRIASLPETLVERRTQGAATAVFMIHPSILPIHPSPEVVTERQRKIIEDMRKW